MRSRFLVVLVLMLGLSVSSCNDEENRINCIIDSDCDDNNDCTTEVCIEFYCDNSTLATPGTPCGDGQFCDAFGECVDEEPECDEDIDCDDENDCTTDDCDLLSECTNDFVTAGMGDCGEGGVCDGAGECVECAIDANCDDSDPCTLDDCVENLCSNEGDETLEGEVCDLGVCTDVGTCVECNIDEDCDEFEICIANGCLLT